jgi:hypothetical protein
MNTLVVVTLVFILAVLQVRLPAVFGLHVEFLPALVAYGALSFCRRNALLLALAAGFTQDTLSAAPFGITALAYGIAALLVTGLGDILDREMPALQFAAGASVSAAAALAAFCLVGFSFGIIPVACLAGLLTLFFFFAAEYTRLILQRL